MAGGMLSTEIVSNRSSMYVVNTIESALGYLAKLIKDPTDEYTKAIHEIGAKRMCSTIPL